jgi:hypothetical protein
LSEELALRLVRQPGFHLVRKRYSTARCACPTYVYLRRLCARTQKGNCTELGFYPWALLACQMVREREQIILHSTVKSKLLQAGQGGAQLVPQGKDKGTAAARLVPGATMPRRTTMADRPSEVVTVSTTAEDVHGGRVEWSISEVSI